MGQYHHPVCFETDEFLDTYALGCGLKEGEQGFTRPGTPAAIVALVSAKGGNMPADCSQSSLIGRWAGKRVIVVGDYAEDGDIQNWAGPALSELFSRCRSEKYRKPGAAGPFYTDLGPEAAAFIEAACNVRFFGDGWKNFVHVKPTSKEFGSCGVGEYVIDESQHNAESLAYLKRMGMKPIDVQRVPRSGDWHGIRPQELPEGMDRVIVNLDTLEYINPVKFGQLPTLAAMVNAPLPGRKIMLKGGGPSSRISNILDQAAAHADCIVDVAGGLFAMLCHPKRRGGGDLPATTEEMRGGFGGSDPRAKKASLFKGCGDIKGRWRGSRILGTSSYKLADEAGADWPTTTEVIEHGTDISDKVIKYLVAVSHY
jgi:hypothetical protein